MVHELLGVSDYMRERGVDDNAHFPLSSTTISLRVRYRVGLKFRKITKRLFQKVASTE